MTYANMITSDDNPIPRNLLRNMRIHIVDQDLYTCESLSVLFRLEGFLTSFRTDWDREPSNKSDIGVILINFDLPSMPGLTALRQAKLQMPGASAFMLANSPDVGLAVLAMKLGAVDVVQKPIDPEMLVRDVRDAFRRDIHVGAVNDGMRKVEVRGFSQLTPREREVLQLLVNGRSNKEAGRDLGISPRTIEVHRARVMEKLGAGNTADLMRIVLTR